MMRKLLALAIISLSLVTAAATATGPYVSPFDVVNAASLTPSRLPGGSIASGSLVQISGVGIGPRKARSDKKLPLKASLAGVAVTVTAGGVTYPASPTYASSSLVKAVLPVDVPAGLATLRVSFQGHSSNPVTIHVVDRSPGLFSINGLGYGPGRITDIDVIADEDEDGGDDDEQRLAERRLEAEGTGKRRTHRRGALVGLIGTGFGASGSDEVVVSGFSRTSNAAIVKVLVGGAPAETFFVQKSAKRPGVDEVGFRIPPDAPLGCYVPVQVVVDGVASNAVTMGITNSKNGRCSDDFNPASAALREGGNVALALLSRVVFQRSDGSSLASDLAAAAGRIMDRDNTAFERLISWPPPGSCTVYSGPQAMQFSLPGRALRLGDLSVTNAARSSRQIPSITPGFYEATWGRNDPAAPMKVPPLPFLDPGVFTFAGSGTHNVARFAVQRTLAPPPIWLNAADAREITRDADLLLEWSGTNGRQAFVMGSATSYRAGASVSFQCLAPPGASSMVIPATVLLRLPAMSFRDDAAMEVGAFAEGTPATFDARGLRAGVVFMTSASAQTVRFK